jgi:hypothetical protein
VAELGDWVDRLCQIDGTQRLAEYRENAEYVADAVGAPKDAVRKLALTPPRRWNASRWRVAAAARTWRAPR